MTTQYAHWDSARFVWEDGIYRLYVSLGRTLDEAQLHFAHQAIKEQLDARFNDRPKIWLRERHLELTHPILPEHDATALHSAVEAGLRLGFEQAERLNVYNHGAANDWLDALHQFGSAS